MSSKKKEFPKNIRITKLYADGYKGLKDFEIDFSDSACWLLAGKNGSGKTRIGEILAIFHEIAMGVSQFNKLISRRSFSNEKIKRIKKLILKIEGEIDEDSFSYELALGSSGIRSSKVITEKIFFKDKLILGREEEKIRLGDDKSLHIKFNEDSLAFPSLAGNEIEKVQDFLKRISLLRPIPADMGEGRISLLDDAPSDKFDYAQGTPFLTSWYDFLTEEEEKTKDIICKMKGVWSDLNKISLRKSGHERVLSFVFDSKDESISFFLKDLSDGERIFFHDGPFNG